MTIAILSADHMSDQQLLEHVRRAATNERRATVQLIALLIELDARKLYLSESCSSLFTYCRQVLHFSEHAAYGRIEAARAARRFPVILERLAEGALHLTAIGLLAAHLTPENHRQVLDAARHKSKREIEELVARLRPKPDVPATVRKLPQRQPASVPLVSDAIGPLEKRKLSATDRPRTTQAPRKRSRTIPAAVRRAVWKRDGGRCAFEGPQGRCTETGRLEYHHVVPFATGGEATISNISMRCRAHNAYEAEREIDAHGPLLLREHREPYWGEAAARSGPSVLDSGPTGFDRFTPRDHTFSIGLRRFP